MGDSIMFLPVSLLKQKTILDIVQCNNYTSRYGLQLTDEEVGLLAESRKEALDNSGRIEFGGGVLRKLVMEFADSPFIDQDNCMNTLIELQECFYYFKNEALEEMTDDELILLMKKHFDDDCQGSVEYLQSSILENYCRDIRYGTQDYHASAGYEDNYIDFYEWDREEDCF
jgi:hypothetical protein